MVKIGLDLEKDILSEIENIDDAFIITDKNVAALYPLFNLGKKSFIIDAGEDSKSFKVYKTVLEAMLKSGCNRKTTLIAIGGGVVGDLTGYAAATFMRGIKWINIPTSLLAQVDSSVGGKTGINLNEYKNIVGAFHNPKKVFISLKFMKTLPARERLSGLGEIVKTAFLDENIFNYLDANLNGILNFEQEHILYMVERCIEFKQRVVDKDPFEITGIRKILNLGHTVGHALEKEGNFKLSHGEYVLHGLVLESYLCKKYMAAGRFLFLNNLLRKVLKGNVIDFDSKKIAEACAYDKKNENGKISIIASVDKSQTKELYFSSYEIEEGLNAWKNEYNR